MLAQASGVTAVLQTAADQGSNVNYGAGLAVARRSVKNDKSVGIMQHAIRGHAIPTQLRQFQAVLRFKHCVT
jgi:hypothetical protein